jgi:hypothetical protein
MAVLVQITLMGAVLAFGREWKGYNCAASLKPRVRLFAGGATILLFALTLWNVILIIYMLVKEPEAMGNKDELAAFMGGIATLLYTDVMKIRRYVRRRRNVAVLLTKIPVFCFALPLDENPLPRLHSRAEILVRSAC